MPWCIDWVNGHCYGEPVEAVDVAVFTQMTDQAGETNDGKIVFVLLDVAVFTDFGLPDVDQGVARLACIATGRRCSEGVAMIQMKHAVGMDDEEGFVVREDGACMMEGLDVECTSLHSWRRVRNLS
jgi:hypothetical protein